MGSGVFNRVWPLAKARGAKLVTPHFLSAEFGFAFVRRSFKGAARLKHAVKESASELRLEAGQSKPRDTNVAPRKM